MFKDRLSIIVAVLLFTLLPFIAKSTQVGVESYAQLPTVSMMAISPDASLLAYRAKENGHDLIIIRKKSDFSIVNVARIDNINPNKLYFVSNNTVVLVATKNIKLRGYVGRHDASWAYAYNIENNKLFPLLSQGHGIYAGQTQLGDIVGVAPDRKSVFMPAFENETRYSLYEVDLKHKKKPKKIVRGTSDTRNYFMNSEGELIARERLKNSSNDHTIEKRVGGKWIEIYRENAPIPTKSFSGVTSDQKHLLYTSYTSNSRIAYFKMSLEDGSVEGPIFSREDRDIERVLTDLNNIVYGVQYSGFKPDYEFFDKKLNARFKGIAKAMSDYYISISDYTPDWSNILLYVDGYDSSGDYFLYQKSDLQYLSMLRPSLAKAKINQVVEYEYKTRDDYTIPTLLTYPAGKEHKNLPTILLPHGGPEAYDDMSFDYLSQYFASQGYLVIQPQFRGSTGFGWKHMASGRGEWGRKMQDDLTDALSALSNEGIVDKDKVCIVGASYGGYAALAGAVFTPELYKCVVSINGVADVERMLKQERKDFGSDHWVVSYWENVMLKNNLPEDHLEKISPINHVSKVQAPVLLIHGVRDEIVPFTQSKEFANELEDADKEVTFVKLKDGNHHLSNAENRMAAMKAIHKFVTKHI